MCEDKPLFYILLRNKDIKIKFHSDPIVLYRISNSSIARNINHKSKTVLVKDNIKFNNILSANLKNPLAKYYFKYQHCYLIDSPKKYLLKINPVLILFKLHSIILSIEYSNKVKKYYQSITDSILENQKHLNSIHHLLKYYNI